MRIRGITAGVALFGAVFVGNVNYAAAAAGAPPRTIALPSAQPTFRNGPGAYGDPVLTPNGRYVVYATPDADVATDTNGQIDIYRYDRIAKTTELVSVGPDGELGNDYSARPAVSADGRYVVFNSAATNFGGGDGNDHLYVRDLVDQTTTRVDADYVDGMYFGSGDNPTISADGSTIAYTSYLGQDTVVIRANRDGSDPVIASRNWLLPDYQGYVQASVPRLDADGGRLFFVSPSQYIAAGDEPDTSYDVFMYTGGNSATLVTPGVADIADATRQISVNDAGTRIAFVSTTQLVPDDTNGGTDVYVHDVNSDSYQLASRGADGVASGSSYEGFLSANGRYVSFLDSLPGSAPDKTDYFTDAFVRDLDTDTVSRRSVAFDAPTTIPYSVLTESAPSNNGRYLVFSSDAPNLAPNTPPGGENLFLNDRDGLVDQAPTPSFTDVVPQGPTPTTIAFTDTSTDSDGRIATRMWTFDDGTTSTAKNPKHTYTNCSPAVQAHDVTLTVTDNRGSVRSSTHTVYVPGIAPGPATPASVKIAGSRLSWTVRNSLSPCPGDQTFPFGAATDVPVVGDWNGDGVTTIGVYRDGTFLLRNSNSAGRADITVHFGSPGDTPVVGDWNGDGTDTIGVVTPSGEWLLRNSNSEGPADLDFSYGAAGAIPVVGDWNGDGSESPGVVTDVGGVLHWELRDSASAGEPDYTFDLGASGDKPVTGDWNYAGATLPGFVHGNVWNLRDSLTSGPAEHSFTFGPTTAVPLALAGASGGGGGGT